MFGFIVITRTNSAGEARKDNGEPRTRHDVTVALLTPEAIVKNRNRCTLCRGNGGWLMSYNLWCLCTRCHKNAVNNN